MECQKMVHFLLTGQDHLRNKNVHRMLSSPLTCCHGNILNYTIQPFQLLRKGLSNMLKIKICNKKIIIYMVIVYLELRLGDPCNTIYYLLEGGEKNVE